MLVHHKCARFQITTCIDTKAHQDYLCGEWSIGGCDKLGLEPHTECKTSDYTDWVPSVFTWEVWSLSPVGQCQHAFRVGSRSQVPNRAVRISESGAVLCDGVLSAITFRAQTVPRRTAYSAVSRRRRCAVQEVEVEMRMADV